jgi:hypothetical protein
MAPRRLVRNLKQNGLTYQELVDSLQREMAARLAGRGPFSRAEMAFILGFADVDAFEQAARRWGRWPPALRRLPDSQTNLSNVEFREKL